MPISEQEFDDFRKEHDFRLDKVPDDLIKATEKAEKDINKLVISKLGELKFENGKMVNSRNNLAKIQEIANAVSKELMGGKYLDEVRVYIRQMAVNAGEWDRYFASMFEGIGSDTKPIYQDILRASQQQALGLFDEQAIEYVLLQPLKTNLLQSVTSGASFANTVKSLATVTGGIENTSGKLLGHVKQVAHDAFAQTDRGYTQVVSEALGVQWYLYAGGSVTDTRDFCKSRMGHYYHKTEIEGWASKDWQGKNKSTTKDTIFIYLGGWQCRHSLLPVAESFVPEKDKERAKNLK